ncbi:hypothetical protein QAD02_010233 [Eretmocerus hayati]|uniref:Uncharacterized protein n=1 Tax=Eretmocerus hayati TaxID=131215 RepID=A0ACC2NBN9_9HYME|nr:hypothetical protein QAD02_010233 [Eretmocerus hayati]
MDGEIVAKILARKRKINVQYQSIKKSFFTTDNKVSKKMIEEYFGKGKLQFLLENEPIMLECDDQHIMLLEGVNDYEFEPTKTTQSPAPQKHKIYLDMLDRIKAKNEDKKPTRNQAHVSDPKTSEKKPKDENKSPNKRRSDPRSTKNEKVEEKKARIEREVEKGYMRRVKYFNCFYKSFLTGTPKQRGSKMKIEIDGNREYSVEHLIKKFRAEVIAKKLFGEESLEHGYIVRIGRPNLEVLTHFADKQNIASSIWQYRENHLNQRKQFCLTLLITKICERDEDDSQDSEDQSSDVNPTQVSSGTQSPVDLAAKLYENRIQRHSPGPSSPLLANDTEAVFLTDKSQKVTPKNPDDFIPSLRDTIDRLVDRVLSSSTQNNASKNSPTETADNGEMSPPEPAFLSSAVSQVSHVKPLQVTNDEVTTLNPAMRKVPQKSSSVVDDSDRTPSVDALKETKSGSIAISEEKSSMLNTSERKSPPTIPFALVKIDATPSNIDACKLPNVSSIGPDDALNSSNTVYCKISPDVLQKSDQTPAISISTEDCTESSAVADCKRTSPHPAVEGIPCGQDILVAASKDRETPLSTGSESLSQSSGTIYKKLDLESSGAPSRKHTSHVVFKEPVCLKPKNSAQFLDFKIDVSKIEISEERLGRGGQGSVYKGRFRRTRVAVKTMQRSVFDRSSYKEISLLKNLQHENIVGFMAWAENVTQIFIVMERVQGKPLSQLIFDEDTKKAYNFNETNKLGISYRIALALNFCHVQKPHSIIIHRDVKPSNIMIGVGYSAIKLCDFGLGKCKGLQSNLQSTRPGGMCGTFSYLPPEILIELKEATTSSDVWSYACTVFETFSESHV